MRTTNLYLPFIFIFLLFSGIKNVEAKNNLLLEKITYPGLTPTAQKESGVKVYQDGKVLSIRNGKSQLLMTLGASVLKKLKTNVSSIPGTATLTDPNPKAPECEDAETETLSVYAKNGKTIPLWKLEKCHEFQLNSAAEVTQVNELKKLFELFRGLEAYLN